MLNTFLFQTCSIKRKSEGAKVLGTPLVSESVVYANVPCRLDMKPASRGKESGGTVFSYRMTLILPEKAPDGTPYQIQRGDVVVMDDGRVLEVVDCVPAFDAFGQHHFEVLVERVEGK